MLDKNSPIPLYYQLAEQIRERVDAGELKPDDQIPPERELGEQHGISRMTVRQAVNYLVRQGVLVSRPGIGTFVAAPKLTYDAFHLLGFTEKMMGEGLPIQSRVLEQALVEPPHHVATRLRLRPGQKTVKIMRLRSSPQEALLLETVYVVSALCPGLEKVDLTRKSLYVLLEQKYRLRLARAQQTLEATAANDFEAPLFGLEVGAPMILLEGVTYAANNQPVEYFKAVYRGDRFKFEMDSHRDSAANLERGEKTNGHGMLPVLRLQPG
jgi:GntR family transcriptional regulator